MCDPSDLNDPPTPDASFDRLQRKVLDLFQNASLPVMPMPGSAADDEEVSDFIEEADDPHRRRKIAPIRRFNLTPRDIKAHLDRFVIRQDEAKRVMAVAVCDHYNHVRRCLENPALAEKAYPKQNVLLLGPTGVGKTHLLRKLAHLIGVPFVKVDATKFSETGYVGHDVEDMVRDLIRVADGDVELASHGIVYIDEVDKLASSPGPERDVSGRGVQSNLLKLLEDTDVSILSQTDILGHMQMVVKLQNGEMLPPRTINTRHILFIASGAFPSLADIIRRRMNAHAIGFGHAAGGGREEAEILRHAETCDFVAFGFEPEFIGRLPVRVAFDALNEEALLRILQEAEDNILQKYVEDFQGYGIRVEFAPEALREIARRAMHEKTGARGLMTVLERSLRDAKFELPSTGLKELRVTQEMIERPAETVAALIAAEGRNP